MEKRRNPAGHLHAILSLLCEMPQTNPAVQCFAAALQATGIGQVLKRAGELADLASRAEEKVRATTGIDVNRYLKWKPGVDAAFSALNFQGPLGPFVGPLKQNGSRALEDLAYCADMLFRHQPSEKEIAANELYELQKEVDGLRNEIRDATIDAELKLFIQYQLGMIRDAIDQYRIFGIDPLERATHQTIGALFFNPEVRNRTADAPVIGKYCSLLVRICQKITVDAIAELLTKTVSALLLPPS